ncbi:MAG: hypothetical protein K0R01_153 [Mycobacterium sp.]|jgi:hypothetical protein|nr:hypothetical protein [Mycobacterium sp.]
MPTPRIDHAEQLRDKLREVLDAQNLPDVAATIDARDIPSGARHGIVVISPPDLEFTTYTQTSADTELSVVAGPADNLLAAWRKLDAILEALRLGGIPMLSARGDLFRQHHGDPLPGYTVRMSPSILIDESENA